MEVGLVGLPNSGKSTLFNALTASSAEAAPFAFCTVEPNRGALALEDARLEQVARAAGQDKFTPAVFGVVDIAGLVKGASCGEGLGNEFLAHVRQVDALFHVLRLFQNPDVAHFYGEVDPVADAEAVESELILADLGSVDRRLEKIADKVKGREKPYLEEKAALEALRSELEAGRPVADMGLDQEQAATAEGLFLLTAKPALYVLNTGADSDPESVAATRARLEASGRKSIVFNAGLEAELCELEPGERRAFRDEYGLNPRGPGALAAEAFKLLDLVSFFTVAGREARAWRVPAGARAEDAAGKIHSDMKQGFIKVEVAHWADLVEAGAWGRARDAGKIQVHGRDYPVRDGDVMLFKFRPPGA